MRSLDSELPQTESGIIVTPIVASARELLNLWPDKKEKFIAKRYGLQYSRVDSQGAWTDSYGLDGDITLQMTLGSFLSSDAFLQFGNEGEDNMFKQTLEIDRTAYLLSDRVMNIINVGITGRIAVHSIEAGRLTTAYHKVDGLGTNLLLSAAQRRVVADIIEPKK